MKILKYRDRVEVIKGFYEGLKGVVEYEDRMNCTYYVLMHGKVRNKRRTTEAWIDHKSLRKIQ